MMGAGSVPLCHLALPCLEWLKGQELGLRESLRKHPLPTQRPACCPEGIYGCEGPPGNLGRGWEGWPAAAAREGRKGEEAWSLRVSDL